MRSQKISLRLPQLQLSSTVNFPIDPQGDIKVKYKSKEFKLEKNKLRSSSIYFKSILHEQTQLQIKESFQETVMSNMLSIIYGNTVCIQRMEVPEYYRVAKHMQIQPIVNVLLDDMQDFIQQYDTFVIIKVAQENNHEALFKLCLDELEKQSFQQLKYHQMELLNLDLVLFKLIIKTNNRYRAENKKGLTFSVINELIEDYSQVNGLSQDKCDEIKMEMFDVSVLNSTQYKQIFLDNFYRKTEQQSASMASTATQISEDNSLKNIQISSIKPKKQLLNSMFNYSGLSQNQIKLYMQNVYLRKKNHQLQKQNNSLLSQLQDLLKLSNKKKVFDDKMQRNIKKMDSKQNALDQRSRIKVLEQFTLAIQKLNNQFDSKVEQLNKIFQEISQKQQIQSSRNSSDKALDQFIDLGSQRVHQMFSLKKQKIPIPKHRKQWLDQSMQYSMTNTVRFSQEKFMDRVSFDQLPISIKFKSFSVLSKMIAQDGFVKKFFKLIYRRSKQYPFRGANNSIFNRGELLILIKTRKGEEIGGYIFSTIHENVKQVQDKKAYIFNFNKKIKSTIKPLQSKKAIRFFQGRFLCFSRDLQISEDFLKVKSQCLWPISYSKTQSQDKMQPGEWFAGQAQFLIDALQIYEARNGQMEMVI